MSDPSDSRSDNPNQDGGSSRSARIPSSRVFIPHWMTRRPTAPSVDSSVPNSPQATLPGIQDPLLPTSPILSQIPSPLGSQPSIPVGTSPVPNGTSSRLVAASSSPAAPPSRPSLSSVRPTSLSPRSFPSPALSSRPVASSARHAATHVLTSSIPSNPSPGATTPTSDESASQNGTSTNSGSPNEEQTTSDGRIRIALTANGSLDSQKVSAICRRCFQSHPHGLGYTWSRVPRDIQNIYWKEFQKKCYWDTNKYSNDQVYRAYKKKISLRYSNYMSDLRNIGQRPGYVDEAIWKEWLDAWNSPEYKRKRERARKNRRKGKEREPAGATHTSGSISHGETFERLTAHLGREPDPHELFMYTHTRKHDGSSWIDQHAQDVEEEYARIVAEIESQQNRADELQAFFQAVGGANNINRIYGLGAAGSRFFNSASSSSGTNGASSSTASSNPCLNMQSQLDRLQSTVDELIALQQRHGQDEGHNNSDRLNLGTTASQVQDVQERFEEF